jgi:CRISPR type III-B/RAMP module-associated protein Cmr3
MKNKYTLQITPLGFFFFGGEETFNTANNEIKANYYAKSNYIPQQTAVLGMLRHLLLMYNNPSPLLNADPRKKTEKVGRQSFETGYDEPYGIIESISPIFIIEKFAGEHCHHWMPAGFDFQKYKNTDTEIKVKADDAIKVFINAEQSFINLPEFDYKEESKLCFKCIETGEWKTIDCFYTLLSKVGVKKNNKENEDDLDAFYKQDLVKLRPQFSFGVNIELKEGAEKNVPDKVLMPFGADQSEFKIEWKSFNALFDQKKSSENNLSKITLLSDAYLTDAFWGYCLFAYNQSQNFRHIISRTSYSNFYSIGNSSEVKKRDRKLNLLSKGSVIYTNKPMEIERLLKGETDAVEETDASKIVKSFRRIGYNYFQTQTINHS